MQKSLLVLLKSLAWNIYLFNPPVTFVFVETKLSTGIELCKFYPKTKELFFC